MKKILKVKGMSCATCALTVEKAAQSVKSVEQANVNLTTEQLIVDVPNDDVIPEIVNAVQKSGYQIVQTTSKLIDIAGMSCATCALTVEKAVQAVDGVEKAEVNFATEKLMVTFDDRTTEQQIAHAVEQSGYRVKAIDNAQEKQEEQTFKIQVAVSVVFAVILFYLAMGHMVGLPIPHVLHQPLPMAVTQLLLSLPIIWVNRGYYVRGLKTLINRHPNMDTLVAIGTLSAFGQGIIAIIAIFFGVVMPIYFESGAVILALITLGKYFEHVSKKQTLSAIQSLMALTPKQAIVIRDGIEQEIPVEMVRVGDVLITKVGQAVALDGIVSKGTAQIDESMLTGESQPVSKKEGDEVVGGSLVTNGSIQYVVQRVGEDTTLSQLIRLVEEAQGSKAPIAKIADTISFYFVPIVLILAVLTFVTWLLLGQDVIHALSMMIAVLIIACPCALGLATPTAIMVGTGLGAKRGVLIKNGEALEQLHHANVVVLDKTGTITTGEMTVTDVITDEKIDDLGKIVSAVQKHSTHPIAQAIVAYFGETTDESHSFEVIDGVGVSGIVSQHKVVIGNERLLDQFVQSDVKHWREKAAELKGKSVVFVQINDQIVALLAIADGIKETSAHAIAQMKQKNIEVIMLTGDSHEVAQSVAKEVGIERIYARVFPKDKVSVIEQLQQEGKIVAMVGDGINDAPALTKAHVGIAIGAGTQVAIESADVVLVKNDLLDVNNAIQLSQKTMRTIKQNLFWAFAYNIICIPIAMGVFYPALTLDPMVAGFAMGFSSISVVLNALWLNLKH